MNKKKFEVKKHKQIKLSNGMLVYLVPDKKLPYVSFEMLVKVGSIHDPQSHLGLNSMVASLLNKGTQSKSALEIADELGEVGASLGASGGKDYTTITGSALSFYQKTLLDMFSEVVTGPVFKNAEIERQRKQNLAAIKKTVDDPSHLASIAFDQYLFEQHPYARRSLGTAKGISNIKKKDIIRFYRKFYRPNNAMLAVVGNYSDNIKDILEEKFKNWKPRSESTYDFPKTNNISGVQIKLIDKDELKQSEVRIGHFGISRTNKDFLSLRLANIVLGGGFTSRLMEEVRVKRGLAYGISASFDSQKDVGSFLISTSTKNESVGESVQTSLNVLKDFVEKGITEEELQSSKALMKGVFPRVIETAERLATNLLVLNFYGVDKDYLNDYIDNVDSLTLSQVNRVIKHYYHPDNLKILVYAPKSKALKQLETITKNIQSVDFKEWL